MATGMLSGEQKELLGLATGTYVKALDLAMPYLASRGIDRASALTRGLGYVSEPVVGHQSFLGRLSIPYVTPSGVVNMTFRCIEDHRCKEHGHSKYMKPKGNHTTLYGVGDILKDTLDIAVVEGEIDTIIMSEIVGFPCVGNPGATNWLPWWTDIFKDFRRVFVFEDGDEQGEAMGDKIQNELGMSVVRVKYPPGEDTNSMYLKVGKEAIREMIK